VANTASDREVERYKDRGKPVPRDQSIVGKKVRFTDDHFEYTAEVLWHGDNGYVLRYTDVRVLAEPVESGAVAWVGGKTPTATQWTVLD
jgi:hypothetical protein